MSLIAAERGSEHVMWDVPALGVFPRTPKGSDLDGARQATFRALKECALDPLLARAVKYLEDKDLGCLLWTPHCIAPTYG